MAGLACTYPSGTPHTPAARQCLVSLSCFWNVCMPPPPKAHCSPGLVFSLGEATCLGFWCVLPMGSVGLPDSANDKYLSAISMSHAVCGRHLDTIFFIVGYVQFKSNWASCV